MLTELITKFSFVGSTAPLEKFNKGLDIGITSIAKIGAVGAVAGVALGSFVSSTLDVVDSQLDMSKTTGVSIASIQEWGFVAQLSGSSAEAFQGSLIGLSQSIGDTSAGIGRSKEVFERLGISVKDASGKVKNADVVMEELRGKLVGLEKAEKISILGKLGIDKSMLQTLESSSEEIEILRQKAKALGVVTDKEAETVGNYKDALDTLGFGVNALKTKFAIALAPQLQKMAEGFTDLLLVNKDLIQNGLNKFMTITGSLFSAVMNFGKGLYNLVDNTIGLNTAIGILTARFILLNKAMFLNPVGLIIAGVTALILIYDDLTNENSLLIEVFNNLKTKAIGYFDEIATSITATFNGVKDTIKGFIDSIIAYFQPLIDTVTSLFKQIANFDPSSLNPLKDISLSSLNPFSSKESNPITPNAITANAVPPSLMNKTLSNQVNNNQQIKIEISSNDPQTAGASVTNALNEQMKLSNATTNNGGL